jgi:hypothetical protein
MHIELRGLSLVYGAITTAATTANSSHVLLKRAHAGARRSQTQCSAQQEG